MKTSFFIFGLLFSTIAYSQETCKARITEPSDKYQLQAQFTCKPENFSFTLQDKLGTEIFRTDNPDFMWDEKTKDGTIMGIKHKRLAVEGVQFHPESILTTFGKKLIKNIIKN